MEGEIWRVPRGFGRLYKDIAAERGSLLLEGVREILGLIGYEVARSVVDNWSFSKRVEAYVYAYTEHLRASDHPIRRHPRPARWPDPWQGPRQGEGVFEGPGGTVLQS